MSKQQFQNNAAILIIVCDGKSNVWPWSLFTPDRVKL